MDNKEIMFCCPVCGTVHITRIQESMLFNCEHCRCMFVVNETAPGSIRPMSEAEVNSLEAPINDDDPLPKTLRIQRGIPMQMKDGGESNIRIGSRFYHISTGDKLSDLLYVAMAYGYDPLYGSLARMLELALAEECQTVDVDKMREKLGEARWNALNMQYAIEAEQDK